MTTSNSRRKKSRQVRKPRSGNRSPFARAFGYGEFATAVSFSIDRHWRKIFGLESGVQMELIRRRPVLSRKLAISKFQKGPKICWIFHENAANAAFHLLGVSYESRKKIPLEGDWSSRQKSKDTETGRAIGCQRKYEKLLHTKDTKTFWIQDQ